jgi:hypothetical protein
METNTGIRETLRKLAVPAAVSAVGGAIGLFLSRKPKQRQAPQLPNVDVGGFAADMRGRLDSALGKNPGQSEESVDAAESFDADKFERRRGERQKRREQRKRRLSA